MGRPHGDKCPESVVPRLGVEPDATIAREQGVSREAVAYWRLRRGILSAPRLAAAPRPPRRPKAGRPPESAGPPGQSRHLGPTVHLSADEAADVDLVRHAGESRADTVARLAVEQMARLGVER